MFFVCFVIAQRWHWDDERFLIIVMDLFDNGADKVDSIDDDDDDDYDDDEEDDEDDDDDDDEDDEQPFW